MMGSNEHQDERREFLAVASKFSAVAAVLGLGGNALTGTAEAADKEELLSLLRCAIDTGDMQKAMKMHGAKAQLDAKQKAALQSLTKNDLAVLKQLRTKLAPHDQLRGILRLEL
jgi:hypothetical protein